MQGGRRWDWYGRDPVLRLRKGEKIHHYQTWDWRCITIFFVYNFTQLYDYEEGTKLVLVFKNRSVKHNIRDVILTRVKNVNRYTTTVTNEWSSLWPPTTTTATATALTTHRATPPLTLSRGLSGRRRPVVWTLCGPRTTTGSDPNVLEVPWAPPVEGSALSKTE